MKVKLNVNGQQREVDVEPRKTLLDTLREDFSWWEVMPVASMACAVPARCCSMASRRAPA